MPTIEMPELPRRSIPGPRRRIHFHVSTMLLWKLDRMSEKLGYRSRNELVETILTQYVEGFESSGRLGGPFNSDD